MRFLVQVIGYLLWLACAGCASAALEGRVVGVTDGDTIKVLVREREEVVVRLFAIDAPETSCHAWASDKADDKCVDKGQPFGKAAKRHLSSLVFGQRVRIVPTGELAQRRTVATVWLDSTDINLEMVKAGFACHYVRFAKRIQPAERYSLYAQAEQSARERKMGQWSDAKARCGWDYRQQH